MLNAPQPPVLGTPSPQPPLSTPTTPVAPTMQMPSVNPPVNNLQPDIVIPQPSMPIPQSTVVIPNSISNGEANSIAKDVVSDNPPPLPSENSTSTKDVS